VAIFCYGHAKVGTLVDKINCNSSIVELECVVGSLSKTDSLNFLRFTSKHQVSQKPCRTFKFFGDLPGRVHIILSHNCSKIINKFIVLKIINDSLQFLVVEDLLFCSRRRGFSHHVLRRSGSFFKLSGKRQMVGFVQLMREWNPWCHPSAMLDDLGSMSWVSTWWFHFECEQRRLWACSNQRPLALRAAASRSTRKHLLFDCAKPNFYWNWSKARRAHVERGT
jgi:hypothetical protein